MKYRHFLFDLDDTLLDFKASERLSFARTLTNLGVDIENTTLFADYQRENTQLWSEFEKGEISKDLLKVERFRRTFSLHGIDIDPHKASNLYLECLPETVVLVDGAVQICEALAEIGEVGIITNGIEHVQAKRVANSGLADCLSFVATSEACGFAKPDARFFEFSASKFSSFEKTKAIIVGDRLDADILGANLYGIDSCWFNAGGAANDSDIAPTYEAATLQDVFTQLSAKS
ncbi:noncanonical pyrimidine nucleotidase, YjjG family [Pectobacterium brasiliense]|uniref:YjjG family noncanonical pyrimidine nucleotidase n=1 Tax=Pectobacterium brasiliense TaxID=180957 RepID=UPI0019696C93|nr:YjjG family noncanonical pyrimidine nucleotidase [Pectobacterium brasiliense]MBN3130539.1 noncanonical pyrimidine nucleotidase, YjjG family [Pectobacterium brasiliense]